MLHKIHFSLGNLLFKKSRTFFWSNFLWRFIFWECFFFFAPNENSVRVFWDAKKIFFLVWTLYGPSETPKLPMLERATSGRISTSSARPLWKSDPILFFGIFDQTKTNRNYLYVMGPSDMPGPCREIFGWTDPGSPQRRLESMLHETRVPALSSALRDPSDPVPLDPRSFEFNLWDLRVMMTRGEGEVTEILELLSFWP